ncbi:hypothetical protein ORF 128R [Red seabream iridovirus]|uniref:Uncharacterized protein n=2 Tax=Infectious spleen and kidney necrosis virus TaxID=180170 RepID=A0A3Q9EGI7_ISKNV|nr:hypothetical protein [Pompano iridovirus]AZQ20913.1 hypothetical protein [Pompano iridovirus]AZQ21041.1 hypothetical protein [Pompano iridovirus]BAK14236.1 hypothetical protein ORF 128R [Red seabream iridovirus]
MYPDCPRMEDCLIGLFAKHGYTWWFRRVMFAYIRDKIHSPVPVTPNLYAHVLKEIADSDNPALAYARFIAMCAITCGTATKDCAVQCANALTNDKGFQAIGWARLYRYMTEELPDHFETVGALCIACVFFGSTVYMCARLMK